MVNDVARAFFEADMKRYLCIELPAEDGGASDEVGFLEKSLYGTRDASANFQALVKEVMIGAGFRQSRYNPAMYWHRQKELKVMVHGDDFISVGEPQSLRWFKEILENFGGGLRSKLIWLVRGS